jgi:hypothetical protein
MDGWGCEVDFVEPRRLSIHADLSCDGVMEWRRRGLEEIIEEDVFMKCIAHRSRGDGLKTACGRRHAFSVMSRCTLGMVHDEYRADRNGWLDVQGGFS